MVKNNLNPDFVHKFIVQYFFEESQKLKFEMYVDISMVCLLWVLHHFQVNFSSISVTVQLFMSFVLQQHQADYQHFPLFPQSFHKGFFHKLLKVALQIFGQIFYKNTKKASLYFQSLLIFIHKKPVVENHLTGNTDRKHSLFLHEQLTRLHTGSFSYSVR